MPRVVHLTSAHTRYDIRIFVKMCTSLAANSYDVSLVVADGEGDEVKSGVKIYDVGARKGGRLSRMTRTVNQVFEKAKSLDAEVYHLHDPELMPIARKLKRLGLRVIFDAHEDLPKQLLGRPYLNAPARYLLSKFFGVFEKIICKKLDAIVTATPVIRNKFLRFNDNSIDINNFPILGELSTEFSWEDKLNEVCYVGCIDENRGVREIVHAMELLDLVQLNFAGSFSEKKLGDEMRAKEGWAKVNELGQIGRSEVANVMAKSKAGIVLFHALPNHVDAQPNKMFEYMSAGLPIITSNFPLWEELVVGKSCGICVDPLDSKAISEAVNFIVDNPDKAMKMGMNGKRAVEEIYNWAAEEKKLLSLYERVIK